MKFNKYKLVLLISSIILAGYFAFRLINISQIILFFPFNGFTDIPTYMTRLHWLKEFGYGAYISNWYDGFFLLKNYWPLWFFITLPFYQISGSLGGSVYFSTLLAIVLTFIAVMWFSKKIKISKLQAFFILIVVFANPYTLTQLIRLWRGPEILGFCFFIISFFYICYLDGKKFAIGWRQKLLMLFLLVLTLLSYGAYFIFLVLVLFGVFLRYKRKEIIALILIPLLLTFPVWNSFLSVSTNQLLDYIQFFDKIAFLIIIPIFWILLFLDYKSKNPLRMYLFPFILSIILFLGVSAYAPLLKSIHASSYVNFFIFLSVFILIKNLKNFKNLKKIFIVVLIPLVLLCAVAAHIFVPYIAPSEQIHKDTVDLLSDVSDEVVITSPEGIKDYNLAFYCYGAIYHNLSTPSGHFYELAEPEKLDRIQNLEFNFKNLNCTEIQKEMQNVGAEQIIVYHDGCGKLDNCQDFSEISSSEDVCLYTLDV